MKVKPAHGSWDTQVPDWHEEPAVQVPQSPPQPSAPHVLPLQAGVHPAAGTQSKPDVTALHSKLPRALQSLVVSAPSLHHVSVVPLQVPAAVTLPHPAAAHWPAAVQLCPAAQLPHAPPQPSVPQTLPIQIGVQVETHVPTALQVLPAVQAPQEPPQASLPHCLPLHAGVHDEMQVPALLHVFPAPHVPQEPPQPSSPQVFPSQFGWH